MTSDLEPWGRQNNADGDTLDAMSRTAPREDITGRFTTTELRLYRWKILSKIAYVTPASGRVTAVTLGDEPLVLRLF